MDLSSQLMYRATLYKGTLSENEIGENEMNYRKVESFFCGIYPVSGGEKRWTPFELEAEEVTYKIIIRAGSSKLLAQPGERNHMYMMIDGVKYDILYCLNHFEKRDRIIIYARMRAE